MNLRKLVVTLAAIALLPTLAHARDRSDSIHDCSDHDIYSGYNVDSLTDINATNPLEAYSDSALSVASINQTRAADPHDVYYGSYSYASLKQTNVSDLHDVYYGSNYQL